MSVIIHNSDIAKIEFRNIKNGFIKNNTNLIFFKIKTIHDKDLNEKCIKEMENDILNFYKKTSIKKIKFIQIYDLTETNISSIYNDIIFFKNYGEFLQKEPKEHIKNCCIGTSILVNSEIIKNITNMLLFVYKNNSPIYVHTTISDAYEYLGNL
jgi:hypothetical protein